MENQNIWRNKLLLKVKVEAKKEKEEARKVKEDIKKELLIKERENNKKER